MKKALKISLSKFNSAQSINKILPGFEFHILASLRKKYNLSQSLFSSTGNIIFSDYHEVRMLAQKMNSSRDLLKHPELTIRIGQLNAMGLLDEIYHYVLRLYEGTANPKVFKRGEKIIRDQLRSDKFTELIKKFGVLFPPTEVYLGTKSLNDYLESKTGDKPHTEVILEEILLLWFANFNPALKLFRELFDDKDLVERTEYRRSIEILEKHFETEKRFGPQNQFIFDLLRAPILASPNSIEGQLSYIKQNWGMILSDKFLKKLLSADDLFKEDKILSFHGSPPTPPVPTYNPDEMNGVGLLDIERFTSDLDWMPNVVLLAKNIYVWMDQLSKKYQRSITKLSEIPDEELDQLAKWNFTALWLIGVWERSAASQKIKQWTGNPEAVSSAYSLYDYTIANDLGGEDAFQNLRYRAWQRGIRLAGDMVPNHMGIFSKWVNEHPGYFIQSDYPPFPNYSFAGGNLSDNPDVEIRIEDGYWNQSDAAVTFQYIDKRNGIIRYIYHGNDGTHMPWNDTAQLDFLKAEVREAIIRTIFHVARKFSIIRFDAAMTLTKRHFQRLWYPQPGSGGDIPSRADYSLSTDEFNKLFPNEFWREVVDRINQEMPNTLLLAEAFWLLEGYFVRTLGMHRVYNSAFMHMLMKEENHKYRELIRNTMHYNPEILKRYVNFISNPDEQTAIEQFGKDDKYFGSALLMVTLPGLPMFAHGQIEGYTEKYGMEYKRAYYNEEPDRYFILRHEQEIFPLIGKRHLFSQVNNFELYDFIDDQDKLNENVFIYSNKSGHERAIICYHNKYEATSGWIKNSVGKNISTTDHPQLIYKTIAQALEISSEENVFYIFKDYKTNLQFIRSGRDFHNRGLYLQLAAFQYHIFLDFKEIHDTDGSLAKLTAHLHGKGISDMDGELITVKLFPAYLKLFDLINSNTINSWKDILSDKTFPSARVDAFFKSVTSSQEKLIQQTKSILNLEWEPTKIINNLNCKFQTLQAVVKNNWYFGKKKFDVIDFTDNRNCLVLYIWCLLNSIEQLEQMACFGILRLGRPLTDIFENFDYDKESMYESIELLKILTAKNFFPVKSKREIEEFFKQREIQEFIKLHDATGVMYFNKERFELLMKWLFTVSIIVVVPTSPDKLKTNKKMLDHLLTHSQESGYKLSEFLKGIKSKL